MIKASKRLLCKWEFSALIFIEEPFLWARRLRVGIPNYNLCSCYFEISYRSSKKEICVLYCYLVSSLFFSDKFFVWSYPYSLISPTLSTRYVLVTTVIMFNIRLSEPGLLRTENVDLSTDITPFPPSPAPENHHFIRCFCKIGFKTFFSIFHICDAIQYLPSSIWFIFFSVMTSFPP